MKIIRARMKGKQAKLEEQEPEAEDAKIVDLMARLRASLEQGPRARGARPRAARADAIRRGGARGAGAVRATAHARRKRPA
jgi:non-homologous end joining protein Ku